MYTSWTGRSRRPFCSAPRACWARSGRSTCEELNRRYTCSTDHLHQPQCAYSQHTRSCSPFTIPPTAKRRLLERAHTGSRLSEVDGGTDGLADGGLVDRALLPALVDDEVEEDVEPADVAGHLTVRLELDKDELVHVLHHSVRVSRAQADRTTSPHPSSPVPFTPGTSRG